MDGLLRVESLAVLQVLLDEAAHDIELAEPALGTRASVPCCQCGDVVWLERRDRERVMTWVPARMLVGCQPTVVLAVVVDAPEAEAMAARAGIGAVLGAGGGACVGPVMDDEAGENDGRMRHG